VEPGDLSTGLSTGFTGSESVAVVAVVVVAVVVVAVVEDTFNACITYSKHDNRDLIQASLLIFIKC
jgi:hypothetical protein